VTGMVDVAACEAWEPVYDFKAASSKNLKYTMWSSIYFINFILTERERPHMVIFQLDVVHNLPNKLLQKSMDEKSIVSLCHPKMFIVIYKPQNVAIGV
jgi:hypothetical protein